MGRTRPTFEFSPDVLVSENYYSAEFIDLNIHHGIFNGLFCLTVSPYARRVLLQQSKRLFVLIVVMQNSWSFYGISVIVICVFVCVALAYFKAAALNLIWPIFATCYGFNYRGDPW